MSQCLFRTTGERPSRRALPWGKSQGLHPLGGCRPRLHHGTVATDESADADASDETDGEADGDRPSEDTDSAPVGDKGGEARPAPTSRGHDDSAGDEATSPDDGRDASSDAAAEPRSWRHLRRRDDDRMVAGVAAGLAEWLDVSPVAVRIGLVALTIFGGAGVLIYLMGWLFLPTATGPSIIVAAFSGSADSGNGRSWWRSIGALMLIGLGVVVIVGLGGELFRGFGRAGQGVALALLVAGAALVLSPGRRGASTGGPTAAETHAHAETATAQSHDAPATRPSARPPRSAAARHRRSPSTVGTICMALLLIYAGAAAILNGTGALDTEIAPTLAGALAIAGIGLTVSAFTAPARGLMAVGVVLATALVLTAGSRSSWAAGIGNTQVRVNGSGASETELRHGLGRLVVDFRSYQPRDGTHEVDIELGAGELEVLLSDRLDATIEADVGTGSVTHSSRQAVWRQRIAHHEGLGVHRQLHLHARAEPIATLELDIDVGIGSVHIVSAPARDAEVPAR